ncbi:hypothetical protein CHISP_3577 [Chitinispirillum alkaliphilum]|nr:hypothetical protein CHISP_3577 [Chitinispirillum alkaliphilum]
MSSPLQKAESSERYKRGTEEVRRAERRTGAVFGSRPNHPYPLSQSLLLSTIILLRALRLSRFGNRDAPFDWELRTGCVSGKGRKNRKQNPKVPFRGFRGILNGNTNISTVNRARGDGRWHFLKCQCPQRAERLREALQTRHRGGTTSLKENRCRPRHAPKSFLSSLSISFTLNYTIKNTSTIPIRKSGCSVRAELRECHNKANTYIAKPRKGGRLCGTFLMCQCPQRAERLREAL